MRLISSMKCAARRYSPPQVALLFFIREESDITYCMTYTAMSSERFHFPVFHRIGQAQIVTPSVIPVEVTGSGHR